MSAKQQLPDELMELVSGGTFTLGGQDITKIEKIDNRGIILETSEGLMRYPWNDRAKEEHPGGLFGGADSFAMFAKSMPGKTFRLEDYTGDPYPVEG